VGINMSDDAAETFGGGVRAFLGSAGFLTMMFGGYYLYEGKPPWWTGYLLITIGLPIFVSPAIIRSLRRKKTTQPEPPDYLHGEDAELGPAIRDMAWMSAWGKWYAAQCLANNPHGTPDQREANVMRAAASIVGRALVNGKLETRGRRPQQMDFESIPSTHWRSSGLHMVRGGPGLWKMIIIPTGGAEINPDGLVVNAHDPIAKERTDNLSGYDSIIVRARHFESIWPRKNKDTDSKRKALLKKAKKAGADPAEIAKLSRD
jgi:hypothetical protein